MKKMIKFKHLKLLLVFIPIFFIVGCPGANESLSAEDLGHNYRYHDFHGLPIISKAHPFKVIITYVVISYDYDINYIIAIQKNCDYLKLSKENKEKLLENQDYYKFALKKGKSKYWIIDKKIDSVYGPMTKREYFKKRYELRIPKDLKLKEY